jgi:non-canonical poly(A) RNA polymerase PAPD5/7
VDFYDHIKPQEFEERIRAQLIQQLSKLCRDTFRDADLYPFGSFPSKLYLPTGDLDLVLCSDSVYYNHGLPKYDHHRTLYLFKSMLVRSGVAATDSDVEVIRGAKVPLVKFIDSRTGLKVDVSFENTTGTTAVHTFQYWKQQYPEMPVLVTLVKHFLAMRGLNEPVNGGIGGFSVICLVVSMLQHMPEIQSRSKNGQHHYGDLLMEFFDLYGNRFNYQNMAISLNPPAYIPKVRTAYSSLVITIMLCVQLLTSFRSCSTASPASRTRTQSAFPSSIPITMGTTSQEDRRTRQPSCRSSLMPTATSGSAWPR